MSTNLNSNEKKRIKRKKENRNSISLELFQERTRSPSIAPDKPPNRNQNITKDNSIKEIIEKHVMTQMTLIIARIMIRMEKTSKIKKT